MKNDLKIFIQSNPQQMTAAKVAEYSFKTKGFKNIEILNLYENELLKNNFGKKFKRNGKIISFNPNDLQSFTLLRFYPPEMCETRYCLIIDPDVFAVKDFHEFSIENKNEKKIFCTKKNNKIRSEVMLIDCRDFNLWNFTEIINNLFSQKIDYSDLINLELFDKKHIGLIDENFNSHDIITNQTILLHTTNRITQPWKIGLDIDFSNHLSLYNLFKLYVKKILGLNYQKRLLEKKYQKHPDNKVIEFVKKLFEDAIKEKFITDEEITISINKKFISEDFFKSLNLK